MDVSSVLTEGLIDLNLISDSKIDVINQVATMLEKEGSLTDKEKFVQDVLKREEEITTGVGRGIAIPHGKSQGVKETRVVLTRLKNPVNWDAVDDRPVNLVVLLAISSEDASEGHLRILSTLAGNLMDDEFVQSVMDAKNPTEIIEIIKK